MTRRMRILTPEDIFREAMKCWNCGQEQEWKRPLICQYCGSIRPESRSARPPIKLAVAIRDGWKCHRCELPINPHIQWPHPLCAVADHYPIPRERGGATLPANLRIAHSFCNGSSGHGPQISENYVLSPNDITVITMIRERLANKEMT
jgi:5-methylcytosine-specific restriction endonuclease McrA